jgi:hypothetical protein
MASEKSGGSVVVGKARIPTGRKNAATDKMGKKGRARTENLSCESGRRKIPPLRGGSFTLWGHRRVGVLRTPGNRPGSVIEAVGGPKAANSGWAIAQNKANLLWMR